MGHKDKSDKLTNPKKVGPGIWFVIHSTALNATNQNKKQEFASNLRTILSSMKCDECRAHAMAYVKDNPPEKFFNVRDMKSGAEIGCFKWSWQFHNLVNKRLKKKELDFETALSMFTNVETCKTCAMAAQGSKNNEGSHNTVKISPKLKYDY